MTQESMEKTIERLEAVYEIQNLMGKYEYLLAVSGQPGIGEEIVKLFAQRDDISASIGNSGFYQGVKGVSQNYHSIDMPLPEGEFDQKPDFKPESMCAETALTTPAIEVAEDGKTAKGIWLGVGFETGWFPPTGKVQAAWVWDKIACDFIKENGQWKIWHLNLFLTFYADYYKSWAEGGEHPLSPGGKHAMKLPEGAGLKSRSPHRHFPYDPNKKRELVPAFPEPYKTYDGNMDWIDPYKPKE